VVTECDDDKKTLKCFPGIEPIVTVWAKRGNNGTYTTPVRDAIQRYQHEARDARQKVDDMKSQEAARELIQEGDSFYVRVHTTIIF
jgi:hypothetical protein